MPVGNIDPKTDTFTRTSMLLGAEEYPSTVQQALCENTGYLMYRPLRLHQSLGGTAVTSPTGTVSALLSVAYLSDGKYDFEVRYVGSTFVGGAGVTWLQLGSDFITNEHSIASSSGTTIIETFTGVTITAGWVGLVAYAYSNAAAATEIYSVDVYSRQYEE